MDRKPELLLELLLSIRNRHGDLNAALVAIYFQAKPDASISKASRDLGLNRNVIRRGMSKKDN
jgi:transposase-like protein